MATPVGSLVVRIGADIAGLVRGGQQAERSIGGVGRSAADTAKRLGAMAGAAAAAGAVAMFALSKNAIAAADNIAKTADKLGVGTEALQEFRYAAERAGVSQNTFDMALQRFTRRAAEAAQGTGEAKDALKTLGVTLTDADGQLRPTEELLGEVADAMAAIPSEAERMRLAFKLFDSEGVAMVNMLADGAAGIDAMRQKARDLGIVLSNDMIRRAEQANDELDDMSAVFRVAGLNLGLEFMPVLRQLAALFTSPEFHNGIRTVSQEISTMISWMVENQEAVMRVTGALAGLAAGRMLGLPGMIAGGLTGALSPEIMAGLGDGKGLAKGGEMLGLGDMPAPAGELEEQLAERREMWQAHLAQLEAVKAEAGAGSAEREAEQMAARLEALREHLMTEAEVEGVRHEERLETLRQALENELITQAEYNRLKEEMEAQHQETITDILAREAAKRQALEQRLRGAQLGAASSFFGSLASIAQHGGDKAFKVQQALAISSALIDTYAGATKALAQWGWPAGAPMMAAALAAGMAQVAAIRSQSPRGGGGGGGGARGGSAPPPTPPDTSSAEQRSAFISLQGSTFGRDQVVELIGQINEAIGDGARLVVR